jgi:hypothetical protein
MIQSRILHDGYLVEELVRVVNELERLAGQGQ